MLTCQDGLILKVIWFKISILSRVKNGKPKLSLQGKRDKATSESSSS